VDEFELIRRYFTRPYTDRDVRLGIGDDGAIVMPASGRELVIVVDTLVEGVHFPANMDPSDIAYRAVAVNLSDIAAMAARPRWMTLALTLPKAESRWLDRFATGLFDAAGEYSLALVGGDTTRGREVVITVQITGDVVPDSALRRSGARIGDQIYVTGTPGDAAAGLALFQADAVRGDDERYLYRRFARPEARVECAATLASHLTAAIDISDGLHADIGKLLAASGAGGAIDIERLPISESLITVRGLNAAFELSLYGGDDYEIAFTAPAAQADAIAELAKNFRFRVTRIGEVRTGNAVDCFRDGHPVAAAQAGYRHFVANDDG
jgi:thiamine-monophosphate kinase